MKEWLFYFLYPRLFIFDGEKVEEFGRLVPFARKVLRFPRTYKVEGDPAFVPFHTWYARGFMMVGSVQGGTIYTFVSRDEMREVVDAKRLAQKILHVVEQHKSLMVQREKTFALEVERILGAVNEAGAEMIRAISAKVDGFVKTVVSLVSGKDKSVEGEEKGEEEKKEGEKSD